jgi:hypothetical protein
VVDVFRRYAVGWHARRTRAPFEPGQYLAVRSNERLTQPEFAASVGSRGDGFDNEPTEPFQGLSRAELVRHHGPLALAGPRPARDDG